MVIIDLQGEKERRISYCRLLYPQGAETRVRDYDLCTILGIPVQGYRNIFLFVRHHNLTI